MNQDLHEVIGASAPKLSPLQTLRHSTAHVLATAVKRLYPEAKVTLGPAIDTGFHYDIELSRPFTDEALAAIEAEMQKIVDSNVAFETLDSLGLCRGPHLKSTREIVAFKLLALDGTSGRIYGTAFPTRKELDEHLHRVEEAKRRDHRTLGKELDLFSIDETRGGLLLWHPRGARIRCLVEQLWQDEHFKQGYELVGSPRIGRAAPVEPASRPFAVGFFEQAPRGHRELPLRLAELGAGDAHLFMTRAQLPGELARTVEFCLSVLRTFGFTDFTLTLTVSARPAERVGDPTLWEEAEAALLAALVESGLPYDRDPGGGASCGPGIRLGLRDAIGREWPCATLQVDLQRPEREDLTYVGPDGLKHRAVVLHRAFFGSIERLVAVLVEHYAGAFPLWLAPVQARVITVTDSQQAWAQEVGETLVARGLRVDLDLSNDKLGAKIRNAQVEKIPLMLVCGDKEVAASAVAPRTREGKQMPAMPLAEFAQWMEHEAQIPRPPARA